MRVEGHWRTFHADDKSASNNGANDLGVFNPVLPLVLN